MTRPAVVIAGAGILGCLIARELAARDPELSITVLDRDAVGAGASRRSAGLHLPRGASPRTRRMSARSHAYYAELRSRHPALPIYPVGATVIGPDGGPGPDYLSEAAPVPAAGSGHPAVLVPDGYRAWRLTGSHHADVHQLTRRLAAGLRPRVRFAEGVAVTGLAAGSGAVTVTTGTGERLVADSVVLAPGPWLGAPAWRDLVAPLGLRVKKVVALHIGQRPGPDDQAVLFDADDAFLLPVGHRGHWLFSYASQEWDVDPDAPPAGLSPAEVGAARDLLRRYAPSLAAACDAGQVFCDAYSPDREPLVRPLDDAGRIIFAGAASGSGYRLAPAIAAEVADLISDKTVGIGDKSVGPTASQASSAIGPPNAVRDGRRLLPARANGSPGAPNRKPESEPSPGMPFATAGDLGRPERTAGGSGAAEGPPVWGSRGYPLEETESP